MIFWEYQIEKGSFIDFVSFYEVIKKVSIDDEIGQKILDEASEWYGILQRIQDEGKVESNVVCTEKSRIEFSPNQIIIKGNRLFGFIRNEIEGDLQQVTYPTQYEPLVMPISKCGTKTRTGCFYNEDGQYIAYQFYPSVLAEYCTLFRKGKD